MNYLETIAKIDQESLTSKAIQRFILKLDNMLSESIKSGSIRSIAGQEYKYCDHRRCCEYCWFISETQLIWEIRVLMFLRKRPISLLSAKELLHKNIQHPRFEEAFEHLLKSPFVSILRKYHPWGISTEIFLNRKAIDEVFQYIVYYFRLTGLKPIILAEGMDLKIYERSKSLRAYHALAHSRSQTLSIKSKVDIPHRHYTRSLDITNKEKVGLQPEELETTSKILLFSNKEQISHLDELKQKIKRFRID